MPEDEYGWADDASPEDHDSRGAQALHGALEDTLAAVEVSFGGALSEVGRLVGVLSFAACVASRTAQDAPCPGPDRLGQALRFLRHALETYSGHPVPWPTEDA
jgi:hypothetical protein